MHRLSTRSFSCYALLEPAPLLNFTDVVSQLHVILVSDIFDDFKADEVANVRGAAHWANMNLTSAQLP